MPDDTLVGEQLRGKDSARSRHGRRLRRIVAKQMTRLV
jgi:hypothetical protein